MADLTYSLSIEDRQALQSLRSVQQQVATTTQSFQELGTAIRGLAVGAFIAQAFNMATAMNTISQSTGIALDRVLGFSQAMVASGGNIERARNGITDFVKNIGEAARGSGELQDAFAKAGVGIADLGRLSEQDLLRKTIAGLASMQDGAMRSSVAMKLFGESVKGVDLRSLNQNIDEFTARNQLNAENVQAAAAAQKNFATALGEIQMAVLAALKPISDMAVKITEVSDTLAKFVKAALEVAIVVAGFFAISRAISLLKAGFALLVTAVESLIAAFYSLRLTFEIILGYIARFFRGTPMFAKDIPFVERLTTLFDKLGQRMPFLKQGLDLAATGFGILGAAALAAWRIVKNFFEAKDDGSYDELERRRLAGIKDRQQAEEDVGRTVRDAITKELDDLNKLIRGYTLAGIEARKRLDFQTELMRATEEQRVVMQGMQDAEQTYLKTIEPILNRIAEIRNKGAAATDAEQRLLPVLTDSLKVISAEYERQLPLLQQSLQRQVEQIQAGKEMELIQTRLTALSERRVQVETAVRDIMMQGQEQVNRAYEDAATAKLPALQRQLREIELEEMRIGRAAKARLAEQYNDDPAALARMTDEIDAAVKRVIESRQAAAREITKDQTSFATGWQQAYQSYVESAANAAAQAKTAFETTTKAMEDAIVNFAKTGKLSFRSFLSSIVEMILRSNVQRLLAQMFGGGGGQNIFASLLGLGGGTAVQAAFSNTALGSSGFGTGLSYGNMDFGGFFAKGGRIGAGQYGIVGESGPEVVTGPATVSPMSGTTTVTYNINAVDVDSFRRLVATDPEFIFAVTEQGRRRLPSQRR